MITLVGGGFLYCLFFRTSSSDTHFVRHLGPTSYPIPHTTYHLPFMPYLFYTHLLYLEKCADSGRTCHAFGTERINRAALATAPTSSTPTPCLLASILYRHPSFNTTSPHPHPCILPSASLPLPSTTLGSDRTPLSHHAVFMNPKHSMPYAACYQHMRPKHAITDLAHLAHLPIHSAWIRRKYIICCLQDIQRWGA